MTQFVRPREVAIAPSGPRHILTGEYPPMPGGVSDYTRTLARALATAGEQVVVWAPAECGEPSADPGVELRVLPDHFGRRGRAVIDRSIAAGSRVLVQYVPHAFGARSMNIGFAAWAWRRRRRWSIDVMFHEVAMPFGGRWQPSPQPFSYNLPAAVHRVMAAALVRAARRTYVSTEAWRPMLQSEGRPPPVVLPVFSNFLQADREQVEDLRRRRQGRKVVGHFGGCSRWTAEFLEAAIPSILDRAEDFAFAFIGRASSRGGGALRDLLGRHRSRVIVTGELPAADAAAHVAACDAMLLPYPDGVTTRRSSIMAALAEGVPVVTTSGPLTERQWSATGVVVLERDPRLCAARVCDILADDGRRASLSGRSRALYDQAFSVSRIVERLRREDG